ncbi:DNA-binding protein [Nonomuraea mesophila]|uniref:DNA-binding protein n=1 Tax=Nonomuraea mesophila TaxID=2530382 RepID=A0A4R5E3R1_9ACTN|nr:helix-turn-helix domain-containing protein [Nonomuraea mesophila]TDE19712.1 DNA-binding protein [Nonomuraea mesophila]
MTTAPRSNDEHMHTVPEIATRLRVSKMTVYRLIHTGELHAIRVGRSFRVSDSALRSYLNASVTTR